MSRPASAEAVAEMRKRHPDLDDLPDEAVAKLFVTHHVDLNLKVRALGRTIRDELPAPIRRWFSSRVEPAPVLGDAAAPDECQVMERTSADEAVARVRRAAALGETQPQQGGSEA